MFRPLLGRSRRRVLALVQPWTHPGIFRIDDFTGAVDASEAGEVLAIEPEIYREPPPEDPFGLNRLRDRPIELVFPQARVISVPSARVIGRPGAVTRDDQLVLWLAHGALEDPARTAYAQASPSRLRRPIRIEGSALCLAHTSPQNYYHFIVDLSTQLAVCAHLGLSPERVVVWGGSLAPWQEAVLAAYGVERAHVVVPPADAQVEFDHLWLASPLNMRLAPGDNVWFYRRDLLDEHVRRIASVPRPDQRDAPRRLFLSRRGYWRTFKNHDALTQLLVEAGFEDVEPGDLAFAEQIALFAGAEAIFAAHGAAMTNLLFAPPGLRVAEVGAEYSPCYAHLCALRGLRHTPIPTAAEHGQDFDAPLELVEEWLASLD